MTAKDESLFVVMDALNQVRGRRRAEKHRSHSHDFTRRVAASFEKTVSSLHFFDDNTIVFGRNFSSHSNHLRFYDDSSMPTTSCLGTSFP